MRLPYRHRLFLRKFLRVSLIALASAGILFAALVIYLEPYLVYDREGVHLDFSAREPGTAETVESTRPSVSDATIVEIPPISDDATIAELGGYTITTSMLQSPETVLEALKALKKPCAVAIELKSIFGNFYYSTEIGGAPRADADIEAVDALIDYLREEGFYMIAVIPAFRDRAFALENTACGLPLQSGALWLDERQCYWLDPANATTLSYLMQIIRELSSLGFREVAFSDFRFPSSSKINYHSEKTGAQLVAEAAETLTAFFESSNVTVSFVTNGADFDTACVRGRIYVTDADGTSVENYMQSLGASEELKELVFLTNSRDTRFDGKAVLRPLLAQ